jgi:hypothetical protein
MIVRDRGRPCVVKGLESKVNRERLWIVSDICAFELF